jgi:hypothetical protein
MCKPSRPRQKMCAQAKKKKTHIPRRMKSIGMFPPTCVTIDVNLKKTCATNVVGPKGVCAIVVVGPEKACTTIIIGL